MSKKDKQPRRPKAFKPRKKKLERIDANEPDQFIDATRTAFDWIRENMRPLAIAAAGILVVVMVILFFQWQRDRKRDKAGLTMSVALRKSALPVKELLSDAQKKKLKDIETFETTQAKYTELAKLYQGVVTKYSGTGASSLARLVLASADLRRGKTEGVEQQIKAFIHAQTDSPLRWLALLDLASYYENVGKLAQAETQYKLVASAPSVYYQVLATMHLGDLSAKSDPKKAREYYKKLLEDKKFSKFWFENRASYLREEIRKKNELLADGK
ncbi:MAG: tetratricopeptide repeat protein [Myxococcales bacterium]|nr:tetratricopeptide repeat protein [Myxococcales bacterium]